MNKIPTRVDWKTILLLASMYATLILNFWLYRTHPLPLVLHILFSVAAIHCAFTIWHEAVHDNVSDSLWFNSMIGILGMFPYMTPYFMQKWIHLQHHAKLNQTDDPNFIYIDGPFWQIPFRYFRTIPYLKNMLKQDPLKKPEKVVDKLFLTAVLSIYFVGWFSGMIKGLLLLWFLPVIFAKIIMDWYINYLPHVGLPPDRFKGTRIVNVPWLTPLILCHNYHAIHHLWPQYPWHRYLNLFNERIDKLKNYGVPIESHLFGYQPKREKQTQPA